MPLTVYSPVGRRPCANALVAQARITLYQVYVLRSQRSFKRYVGVTAQPLEEKLKEHNQGSTAWTRDHKPFKLVYFESFESKAIALSRERFFKTGQGRRVLDRIIK